MVVPTAPLTWADYATCRVGFCPACEGKNVRPIAPVIVRDTVTWIPCSICDDCGTEFHDPVMTPEAAEAFYRHGDYRRLVNLHDTVEADTLREQRDRVAAVLDFIGGGTYKYAVDIGSSAGCLLMAVRDKYACRVLGVEVDDKYREYAIENGIPCVDSLADVDGQPDLVTIIHTLEHIPFPLSVLRKVREWAPTLVVEVPLLARKEAHPVAFSLAGITAALLASGFMPLTISEDRYRRTLARPC